MTTIYSVASLMLFLANGSHAFAPTAFVPVHQTVGVSSASAVQALPTADLFWNNNELLDFYLQVPPTSTALSSSTLIVSSAVEIMQTIALVLGGIVAFLLLLSFLTAKFLLPQAAKDLEEQTKDKYPDLWQEALGRLEPGESLAMRPDLIQEYGKQLQDRMTADFVAQQQAVQEQKNSSTASSMTDAAGSWMSSEGEQTSHSTPKKDVVDVEFTKEETSESS